MKFLALALLAFAACKNNDAPKKVGVTFDDVKRDSGNAVDSAAKALDTTAAYVTQSKDDYLRALEHKLAEASADIAQGQKELAHLNGQAKVDAQTALSALEAKRDALKKDIEEVKNDTADQWQEARRKVQTTADALDAAAQTFKEKMR